MKCQTLVKIFEIQKLAKNDEVWDPPIFSPENFFTKLTQNGLKWILNTTLKNVTFCQPNHKPNHKPNHEQNHEKNHEPWTINRGLTLSTTRSSQFYFLNFLENRLLRGLLLKIWNSFNFSSGVFSILPEFIWLASSIFIDLGFGSLINFECVMNQTISNSLWFQTFFSSSVFFSVCFSLKCKIRSSFPIPFLTSALARKTLSSDDALGLDNVIKPY